MNVPELSRGSRQLVRMSCLTSADRVTLTSRTTFLHINALARLTGTTLGPDSNRGDREMDSKLSFFKKRPDGSSWIALVKPIHVHLFNFLVIFVSDQLHNQDKYINVF